MTALRHRDPTLPTMAATWLVLAFVALALRLPDIGNPLIDLDEQFYLLVGDRMLHGAVPYVDIWDRKPVGLFLIYAAARAVGGDPWLGYQLLATVSAIVTAGLIAMLARTVAGARAGVGAGAIYLLWLGFLGGRGGQSPVFYDALTAGAALLVWQALVRPRLLWRGGIAAMLACGIAMQIKPTAVFDGGWFGVALLIGAGRARWRMTAIGAYAAALVTTALVPTLLAFIVYRAMGHGEAWWFATIESIFMRGFSPAEPIAGRLTGIALMLLVPVGAALLGAIRVERSARWFLIGWAVVALVGLSAVPPYYNHYALPLLVPIAVLGGIGIAGSVAMTGVVAAAAAALLWLSGYPHLGERAANRAGVAQMAATVDRYRGGECLFAVTGPPALYVATRSCLPTRYPFAPHLTLASETGAIGVDQLAELRRTLATRPPVIVTGPPPAGASAASITLIDAVLARDYRAVGGWSGYSIHALRHRPAGNP